MATLAKIEANRRNAKRSTGPKTVSGKVASSKNAMRHGLLSREIVLPDESAEDFARFSDRLATHFGAQGAGRATSC